MPKHPYHYDLTEDICPLCTRPAAMQVKTKRDTMYYCQCGSRWVPARNGRLNSSHPTLIDPAVQREVHGLINRLIVLLITHDLSRR